MRWGRSDKSLAVLGKGLRGKQKGEGFYNIMSLIVIDT